MKGNGVTDSNDETILAHYFNKKPRVLGIFHISILLPIFAFPFIGFNSIWAAVLWGGIDVWLRSQDFTLMTMFIRIRLWLIGRVRKCYRALPYGRNRKIK